MTFLFSFFAASLLGADISRPRDVSAARQTIQQTLKAGTGLVIVVAPDKAPNPEDEAYGDWADNLNSFATSLPATVKVVRMTAALYARVFSGPRLKKEFATVFVHDHDHALLHDGRIMERLVYRSGLNFMNASGNPSDRDSFLAAHGKELSNQDLTRQSLHLLVR